MTKTERRCWSWSNVEIEMWMQSRIEVQCMLSLLERMGEQVSHRATEGCYLPMHSLWLHILRVLAMNKNNCVDVNRATGLYAVDSPLRLMSQEAHTETRSQTRFVVTRHVVGETPKVTATDMTKNGVHYTFDGADIISVVREVITTTTERTVMYQEPTEADYEEMSQHFAPARKPRKTRKTETKPRATCYSSCCGTPNRRERNGTCAGCRPNRYPLPQ